MAKEAYKMKISIRQMTFFTLIALAVTFSTAAHAQTRAYTVSDRQVQRLLDRIETRTNDLTDEINRNPDKNNTDSLDRIVSNFADATYTLKENFSSSRSSAADVQNVLNKAVLINNFMQNNRMLQSSQNLWTQIRADLDTLAGYYQVRSAWNDIVNNPGSNGGYTVSDLQMRNLLYRLKRRSTTFRLSFNRWNNINIRSGQTGSTEDISQNITTFNQALNNLSSNYKNRNSGDVEQVLNPSASINSYLAANRTNTAVTSNWNLVRTDLTTLAGYYRLSWDWNNTVIPGDRYASFDSRFTGTYRLNAAQSDNVPDAVEQAIDHAKYDESEHERMHRNLERRLTSPDTLTLEKRGQDVKMSSTNGQVVTLNANGVAQTETSPSGRTVTTNVTTTNRDLTINYEGERMNDFYVTFTPLSNGQLKVTRRVYLENQDQTVTVSSVYDKTSPTPQWNTAVYPPNTDRDPANRFLIPNNTALVATLDRPISTRTAQNGDRFSMTVMSPSQYEGAVIEGTVKGQQSGVVSGRANLSLSFDTIRMSDGRIYRFAGIVDQVRQPNGNTVNINNEGSIRDTSQTTKTVEHAGVGAVLGAIIGAIAGGGQGAAIGAGVGAGAGAGTVVLQGRDNLELASGSQFSITSTAPANVGLR